MSDFVICTIFFSFFRFKLASGQVTENHGHRCCKLWTLSLPYLKLNSFCCELNLPCTMFKSFFFNPQTKLEQYRVDIRAGKKLNEDQQLAIQNYDNVLANLDLMRELSQQCSNIVSEHNKVSKRQLKREQQERFQEEVNRVKEILKIQVWFCYLCRLVCKGWIEGETKEKLKTELMCFCSLYLILWHWVRDFDIHFKYLVL